MAKQIASDQENLFKFHSPADHQNTKLSAEAVICAREPLGRSTFVFQLADRKAPADFRASRVAYGEHFRDDRGDVSTTGWRKLGFCLKGSDSGHDRPRELAHFPSLVRISSSRQLQ
jgi:hypothetical protein